MDAMELFFGREHVKRHAELEDALRKIEEKHIDFFKSRESKFEADDHDRLHNHWMMTADRWRISFGFDRDSDLPKAIMEECASEFNRIFIKEP